MIRKSGCLIAIVGGAILFVAIIYIVGKYLPYDTTGEGPWPENYR